ncbi:MAG: hypothetical protein WDM94_09225 [Bauldia sp.]
MFTIAANPTFTHKVRVQVPVKGGWREEVFTATFRVVPTDELADVNLMDAGGTTTFLQSAIVGLDELQDEAKQAIPYSEELRDRLITIPYVRQALVSTYFEGVSKAKTGN